MVAMLLIGTMACTKDTGDSGGNETPIADADGDGADASTDCNDDDDTVHPGADEICDGLDNDCNSVVDDAPVDGSVYYADTDGDGYGAAGTDTTACAPPAGYVANADDCDDGDALLHPDTQWYDDDDGDGYGDDASGTGCVAPPSSTLSGGDCDDENAATYPGAPELCDTEDNDCDDAVDDDPSEGTAWYVDDDGDGYGDETSETLVCWGEPKGMIAQGFDCDDGDPDIHPGVTEECDDTIDSDCSGRPDNGCDVLSSADADWHWGATSYPATLGFSTANLGDLNGDGKDELGVSAPEQTSGKLYGAGAAYVIDGTTTSGSYTDVAATAAAAIYGDTGSDLLGQVIESAGDVNHDGIGDLIVGSWNTDMDACLFCGDSRLFFGPLSGTLDQMDADVGVPGVNTYEFFGDIATSGDFDGDGNDDLIVGGVRSSELGDASYDGIVYFFPGPDLSGDLDLGSADATFYGAFYSFAGTGITTLRDADGDGVADFAIAQYDPETRGQVFLLHGPVSGIIGSGSADATYIGAHVGDGLGFRCEWAGDVDGDGSLDLALSAPFADEEGTKDGGAVYLVYGPLIASVDMNDAEATIYGASGSQLGDALAEGGDVDGDGKDDVAVASPRERTVAIFYGPVEGPRSVTGADVIVEGAVDSLTGWDVDLLDFDGDGAMDVAFGATGSKNGGDAYVLANTSM
jgi:hypothetical protein